MLALVRISTSRQKSCGHAFGHPFKRSLSPQRRSASRRSYNRRTKEVNFRGMVPTESRGKDFKRKRRSRRNCDIEPYRKTKIIVGFALPSGAGTLHLAWPFERLETSWSIFEE